MRYRPITKLLCSFLLLLLPLAAVAEAYADLVFRNGVVYTVDAERSWAQAVAITDGRISYVGDDAGAVAFIGNKTRVIDLSGRMLMPGFHDSHMHPMSAGTRFLRCRLHDLAWPDEILVALRECEAELANGEWLHAVGLPGELFAGGQLNLAVLDETVTVHPVFITDQTGFTAWVNSKALSAAGITEDTVDPPRGRIGREVDGTTLTGVLHHSAAASVRELIPVPGETAYRKALSLVSAMANGFGITSVNAAKVWEPMMQAYLAADAAGEMTLRVQASQTWIQTDGISQLDQILRLRDSADGKRFKADAVKLAIDGDILRHTAALLEPYTGSADDRGEILFQAESLNSVVTALDAKGLQVHMHVVGDRAVRNGLDAIEQAINANGPRDRRHQLAHVKLINPSDLPRFAELGVVADFQSLWAKYDVEIAEEIALLGTDRSRWLMPINSMMASGARVVAGSDWISDSMNPLVSIQIAITRRPTDGSEPSWLPEQRVTLAQMIDAFTINGAWLARQEHETGSIEVGKAADLIVLDRNLFEVEPMQIHLVKVRLTLLEGEVVFEAAGSAH